MKIGCITTSIIPSKTANSIQAVKVVHALRQLGHDVHLWVPEFQKSDWETIAHTYGILQQFPISWIPFHRELKQYDFSWKAVQKARQWGADFIYTWTLQSAFFASLKKIVSVMEFHDFPMGFMGPNLFRWLMASSTPKLIMCTTNALAEGIEEHYNIHFSDTTLQIAPNGTDPERYDHLPDPEDCRNQLGLTNTFTVGYTGHFYAGRGMSLLMDIAKNMPHVQFLWVGGQDKDIRPWQDKLSQLSIENVHITGFIPNSQLPLYQGAADILLMPYGKKIAGSSGGDISRVINPMKMFDYLGTGRPIIASEIPVFHEILDNQTTLFCNPEKGEEWVAAIHYLKENEEIRQQMSSCALEKAKIYSWKNRASISLQKINRLLQ